MEKRWENRRAAYKVNARNDVPALATIFSLENLSASTVGTSSKVAHLGVCKPNADGNGDPGWGRHYLQRRRRRKRERNTSASW